jgi:hypothetical protein
MTALRDNTKSWREEGEAFTVLGNLTSTRFAVDEENTYCPARISSEAYVDQPPFARMRRRSRAHKSGCRR